RSVRGMAMPRWDVAPAESTFIRESRPPVASWQRLAPGAARDRRGHISTRAASLARSPGNAGEGLIGDAGFPRGDRSAKAHAAGAAAAAQAAAAAGLDMPAYALLWKDVPGRRDAILPSGCNSARATYD